MNPDRKINYKVANVSDAEQLATLRVDAMEPSLAAIGRFDPKRARNRFLDGFSPEKTQKIVIDKQLVGFYVLESRADHVYLSHSYVAPGYQNLHLGTAVINKLKADARQAQLPIRLGALRGSRSNEFYSRHGFIKTHENEFDIYYEYCIDSK